MLISRKAELEIYKKQQAELIREEKRLFKHLQDEEVRSKQQSRQDQIQRIKELEDKLLEEIESKARRSRNSSMDLQSSVHSSYNSLSTSRNDHLDRVKEIHEKARNMMKGQPYLEEIPEKPSPVKAHLDPVSPVKIPVFIPQSMLRKAQNLPPPTVQRVLKNGEVITVHLLSDKSRVNDPLVKAEAQLDQSELNAMSKQLKGKPVSQVINDIQNQFINGNDAKNGRADSMPPKKKYKNEGFKLPEADLPELRQSSTPKGRAEYYNFRDIALDVVSQQTNRSWVSQRMKQYSDKVKQNYVPKHSDKKELEMILMKEKLKKEQPMIATSRVRILE